MVDAKLYVRAQNSGSYTWLANCALVDGADHDSSQADGQPTGGNDGNVPMSMSLTHTATSPDTVTLSCYQQGSTAGTVEVAYTPVITAIAAGALN